MQCVVLSGGFGTRMQHLSKELPKNMLPIGDRSFMEWQLSWLKLIGIEKVVLSVGFQSFKIEECIQNSMFLDSFPEIICKHDGPEPLGTGGAVAKLLPYLEEDFIVTYGDSFVFLSAHELFKSHLQSKKPATMSIFKNEKKFDTSNVSYNEKLKSMHYDKFNITEDMNYIDYGMLVLNKSAFKEQVQKEKFDLAAPLVHFSKQNQLNPFLAQTHFQEIGSPAGYEGFKNLMQKFHFNLDEMKKYFKIGQSNAEK